MQPELARIAARSRRQAMDWSLVLASQHIEAIIDYSEEGLGWGLLVPAEDFGKAIESLRLYRLENRRWNWRPQVLSTGLLFDWTSLLWVLLICVFYWLTEVHPAMREAGLMVAEKVSHGEWWRLFTAMWLHADVAHLAANATLGLVLLGLAMGRYGAGIGSLAAYLAGAGGNLAVWLFPVGRASLGASGMVMGGLGLLAAQSLSLRPRTVQETRRFLTGVLGGVLLFVLVGLSPESDVRAHLGGFISGMVLGALLNLISGVRLRARLNLFTPLLLILLTVWPWYCALRR